MGGYNRDERPTTPVPQPTLAESVAKQRKRVDAACAALQREIEVLTRLEAVYYEVKKP